MTDQPVAFLRERLDEDEQIARAAADQVSETEWTGSDESGHAWRYQHGGVWGDHDGLCSDAPLVVSTDLRDVQTHIARHDPARVLAEIDAKRRILAEHERIELPGTSNGDTAAVGAYVKMQAVLRLLALPYTAHPDYRQEWRP